MITEQQIKECSLKDLPKPAGKVLQNSTRRIPLKYCAEECGKAQEEACLMQFASAKPKDQVWQCPLDITLANAFKCRDQAVEKHGAEEFVRAMWEVFYSTGYSKKMGFVQWLSTEAESEHFIKAACICEIKENKK